MKAFFQLSKNQKLITYIFCLAIYPFIKILYCIACILYTLTVIKVGKPNKIFFKIFVLNYMRSIFEPNNKMVFGYLAGFVKIC